MSSETEATPTAGVAAPEEPGAAEEALPAPELEIVTVRLGPAEFGIPIQHVREVLRVPPIAPVPFTPEALRGLVSVRGALLPVVDLGIRLLGAPAARPGRLAVVQRPDAPEMVALLVDAVTGLETFSEARLRPMPPELEAALPEGIAAGVVSRGPGRLVTLLRLQPVLALAEPTHTEHENSG